jgi:hypothetical protein
MSTNKNNGIATPVVRLISHLPKVSREVQNYNFDITAHSWNALKMSPVLSPVLMENVANPEGTFAVCFPSKRKTFVNNFTKDGLGTNTPTGTIIWTPVGPPTQGVEGGVITDYIKGLPSYYEDVPTTNPASRIPLNFSQFDALGEEGKNNYKGPIWLNKTYTEQPQADDKKIAKNFFDFISGTIPEVSTSSEDPVLDPGTSYFGVDQTTVADGLWWGIESNDFLQKNMPFWITLEKPSKLPSPAQNETFFIISLGIDSTDNTDRFDIVLSLNKKPTLIDYYGPNETVREFESEAARINSEQEIINVGIMTSGGRLIIFVNGSPLVYSRVVKTGADDQISTLKEANISAGKIRVYGSNLPCLMYAYPMTFAQFSALTFPIPTSKKGTASGAANTPITYSAPNERNEPSGQPVCVLPVVAGEEAGNRYGIDAKRFTDENGTVNIQDAFGLHGEGLAAFTSASTLSNEYSALPNTGYYLLTMKPEDRSWLGTTVKYAKTPYFFRLKGVDVNVSNNIINLANDISDDIISVKETASAPDYFHIKKQATFTLYNENGQYDFLRSQQVGVDISWGWNGLTNRTFTGMNVSASSSEIAGKETLTVQCEDYNYILQNTPIINSPYYDGMVGYHAVRDLAKRAGLKSFQRDWTDSNSYFLKSGYSFSSPQMRFKSTDKIFDCIMGIVKRFEAYTYFDGMGTMHIDKLPGGLLGAPSALFPSVEFTSSPTDIAGSSIVTDKVLILENKNIDIDLKSTVNHISILTLQRDTRYPAFYAVAATPAEDILGFKKKMMIDQPAYGEIAVAKAHAQELKQRVFKPIRKTSFKTVGIATAVIEPLAFITVDGVFFRLISLSRDFNAETNDFVQNYECEWLNG